MSAQPPIQPTTPAPAEGKIHAWSPLRERAFLRLWSVALTANICVWMSEFSVAWTMTQLTTSVVLVALVQSAASLPVFLLGLPFGAVADMAHKRRLLMASQVWVAGTAVLFVLCYATGLLNPYVLLALTFANGISLAIRWPVFSALLVENLPKRLVPSGMALGAVAMNTSRIVGPLTAGLVMGALGAVWVFALNLLLALVCIGLLRSEHIRCAPPAAEKATWARLGREVVVGVRFVAQHRDIRRLLGKVVLFFLMTSALTSLLPLQAARFQSAFANPATPYSLMFVAMGVGAIFCALVLPRLRERWHWRRMVQVGFAVNGLCAAAVAYSPYWALSLALLWVFGFVSVMNANSMAVQVQLALPDWVRARGMSTYQLSIMGAVALGAMVWGNVTAATNMYIATTAAAVLGLVCAVCSTVPKAGEAA